MFHISLDGAHNGDSARRLLDERRPLRVTTGVPPEGVGVAAEEAVAGDQRQVEQAGVAAPGRIEQAQRDAPDRGGDVVGLDAVAVPGDDLEGPAGSEEPVRRKVRLVEDAQGTPGRRGGAVEDPGALHPRRRDQRRQVGEQLAEVVVHLVQARVVRPGGEVQAGHRASGTRMSVLGWAIATRMVVRAWATSPLRYACRQASRRTLPLVVLRTVPTWPSTTAWQAIWCSS